MEYAKHCDWCGETFLTKRKHTRFCGSLHRQVFKSYKDLVNKGIRLQSEGETFIVVHDDKLGGNTLISKDRQLSKVMDKAISLIERHNGKDVELKPKDYK